MYGSDENVIQHRSTPFKHKLLPIFIILALVFEWALSLVFNISNIVLITYLGFLCILFFENPQLIFDYFWILIVFSLNVLGVWVCETKDVYLVELARRTTPVGSLLPVVACYIIFFFIIASTRQNKKNDTRQEPNQYYNRLMVLCLYVGIICIVTLFMSVIRTPYFLTGLERIPYLQQYTKPWEQSLKAHLLMLIPIAGCCGRNGYIKSMFVFMSLLLLYYFWVGDKFGAYLFAIYLFAVSYFTDLKPQKIRRLVCIMSILVMSLLIIVMIQRKLLFGDSLKEFWEYLFHRLAQQGEVWWSVFEKEKGLGLRVSEFIDEIFALLPLNNIPKENQGQWKMMIVSSDYSVYSYYRVGIGNPYTSTTTASVFYYFKWIGLLFFYCFSAHMYKTIIHTFIEAIRNNRVLEAMFSVKLISYAHGFLTASDGTLFSYRGLVYLFVLAFLINLRKRNVRMRVRYGNRCINFI